MTNIPIRNIPSKSSQEEIVKNLWQKEESKPQETATISHDSEEKVVSYTADIKTYTIAVLAIIILAILVGYNLRDTTVQDALDNIQYENRNKAIQEKIIDRAMISKVKSDSSIEKSKEALKKYNIIYK